MSTDAAPDPRWVARLRDAADPGVPEEVWELATRPRGEVPADLSGVRSQVSRSPALRPARRMHDVLAGSRVLWIEVGGGGEVREDSPGEDSPEVLLLKSLGVAVTREDGSPDLAVVTTHGAMAESDLAHLRGRWPSLPLVVYRADPDPEAPQEATPAPAAAGFSDSAGATHDPSELLHRVLDVLERVRL